MPFPETPDATTVNVTNYLSGAGGVLRGRLSAATQTLANGVFTDIGITVTEESRDIFTVASPTITINERGLYEVAFKAEFATNVNGDRVAAIWEQFVGTIYQETSPAANTAGFSSSASINTSHVWNAGSNIRLQAYQNSGGNLDVVRDSGFVLFTHFTIKKIADV